MAQYKLHYNGVSVYRLSDGALIPFDAGNRDYLEYLAWTRTGQKADPADPNPFLPQNAPTPPTLAELQAQLNAIQEQIDAIS